MRTGKHCAFHELLKPSGGLKCTGPEWSARRLQEEGKRIGRADFANPVETTQPQGQWRALCRRQARANGWEEGSKSPACLERVGTSPPQQVLQRCGERCAEEVDQSNASEIISACHLRFIELGMDFGLIVRGSWSRRGLGVVNGVTQPVGGRVPFGRTANASGLKYQGRDIRNKV